MNYKNDLDKWMSEKGKSASSVAKAMEASGVELTRQSVQYHRTGVYKPSETNIKAYARVSGGEVSVFSWSRHLLD